MSEHVHIIDLIKREIAVRGVSVRALAASIGLPHRSVQNVLDGKEPKVDRAAEICRALGFEFYIGRPRTGTGKDSLSSDAGVDSPAGVDGAADFGPTGDIPSQDWSESSGHGHLEEGHSTYRAESSSLFSAAPAGRDSFLVRESDLSLPALRFLAEAPEGFLTTAVLIGRLEALFKPTGLDAEVIPGRADTRFSQKVRNIISHRDSTNNPIKRGWIDYDPDKRGLRITRAGRSVLEGFTFGPSDAGG